MPLKELASFYFSFKGRATRYDFNIRYALVVFVGGFFASIADYTVFGGSMFNPYSHTYFANVWNLFALLASLAVTCRRLHDMNYSGWWQLGIYCVPSALLMVFYFTIGAAFFINPLSAGFAGFIAVSGIILFYVAYFILLSSKRGTIGANRYGNDPLQANQS